MDTNDKDAIVTVNYDEMLAKKRIVLEAAKKAVYSMTIGKMLYESIPDNMKEEILNVIDKDYFINVAGAMAASLIGYEEVLAKIEDIRTKSANGEPVLFNNEEVSEERVFNILKIGGYLKSILESTEDVLIKESEDGDKIIDKVLNGDGVIVSDKVPEPILDILEDKDFSDVTSSITQIVITTIKKDIEDAEKDKAEEEEFHEELTDAITPSEDNTDEASDIEDNEDVEGDESTEVGDESGDENEEENEDDDDFDDDDDDEIEVMNPQDSVNAFSDDDDEEDESTEDIKEEKTENEEEEKTEEEEKNEKDMLQQESITLKGCVMPSLYREKTKSATIRIMESIGSFYDVYIAMTGKANSKEAIYLESVTSELNKQLREVTSKVTETFGIFDKIFGGVEANMSANLGHDIVKLNIDWLATESVGLKILRMFAELYISIQSGAAIGWLITIALFSSQITLMTFLGPIIFGIIAAVSIYVKIIKNNKKYAARIHATYTQMIKNLEAELVKARADKDEKRVSDLTKAIEEAKDILEKADKVRGETEAIKFINGVRKVYDDSGLKGVDTKKLEKVKDVKLVKEDYTDRLCMLFGESVKSEITDVLDKLKDGLDGVFKQNGLNPSDESFNIDNITAYVEQLNSKATTFVKWYFAILFGLAGGIVATSLATLVLTHLVGIVMGGLVGLLVCLWFVYHFNKEDKKSSDAIYGMLKTVKEELVKTLDKITKGKKLTEEEEERVANIKKAISKIDDILLKVKKVKTKDEYIDFVKIINDNKDNFEMKARDFDVVVKGYYVDEKI